MTDKQIPPADNSRILTGVPGLDFITNGGLMPGGLYLVQGTPGAGKTILGNQICFKQAALGKPSVFLTLLTETHGKMLQFIRGMSFFDETAIDRTMQYINGFKDLSESGVHGLLELIAKLLCDYKPKILVIDGFGAAALFARDEQSYSSFLHGLNTLCATMNCTALALASTETPDFVREQALIDGVIDLRSRVYGARAVRLLQVLKFGGSDSVSGLHAYKITDQGLEVYPRTEAMKANIGASCPVSPHRLSTGIPALDSMLDEGLVPCSVSSFLGAPGTGKTILGLKFLEGGLKQNENGIYFGFNESKDRLLAKARAVGIALLNDAVENGKMSIIWQPPLELMIDELSNQILDLVETTSAKRLFIDGIDGLTSSIVITERKIPFLISLFNKLRAMGVTTALSVEAPIFSPELMTPLEGLSAIIDNVFMLRYVELKAHLYRLISIIKVRDSGHETSLREFSISKGGIELANSFESAEAVMTGAARFSDGGHEKQPLPMRPNTPRRRPPKHGRAA